MSGPFDASPQDLCRKDQVYHLYLMVPEDMIESWAPMVKVILASAKTLKRRAPDAPRQTWVIDEAGRLFGYSQIVRLFTDGAGIGIRPFVVFQDFEQANKLMPGGAHLIASSAAVKMFFGVRDDVTAKLVSNLLGYYLCQTKECNHYGKSIPRDKIESEVGGLVKEPQPTPGLIKLATEMFRKAWDMRKDQAQDIVTRSKLKLKDIEKQKQALIKRLLDASDPAVIDAYESKLSEIEKQRAVLSEKIKNQVEPVGTFEEKLEPAMTFLSNPWKIWERGQIEARRLVLKLCFTERIPYCRFEGARTAQKALLFKEIDGLLDPKVCFGAGEGTRTPTPKAPEPKSGASTNSATPARKRPVTTAVRVLANPAHSCEQKNFGC